MGLVPGAGLKGSRRIAPCFQAETEPEPPASEVMSFTYKGQEVHMPVGPVADKKASGKDMCQVAVQSTEAHPPGASTPHAQASNVICHPRSCWHQHCGQLWGYFASLSVLGGRSRHAGLRRIDFSTA